MLKPENTTRSEVGLPEVKSSNLVQRPAPQIEHLFNLLLPSCRAPEETTRLCQPDDEHLILIVKGSFETIRFADALRLGSGTGPAVTNLMSLFGQTPRVSLLPLESVTIARIETEQARGIINSEGAWYSVSSILAYYLSRSVYRDQHMVARSTYDSICYRLHEYLQNRDHHIRNNLGIVNYIISSTHLSRSQVYNIVTALNKGGYIEILNGKLIHINNLPARF